MTEPTTDDRTIDISNDAEFEALFGSGESPTDDTPVTFEEFETLLKGRGIELSPERVHQVWESSKHIPPAQLRQSLSASPPYNPRSIDSGDRYFDSAVAFVHTEAPESTARRLLLAYPQAIFKPTGLWLWGCDPSTLVHNMKVGNITGYLLSHVSVPGLYFEAGLSFADFEKLLDSPTATWSHEKLRELPPLEDHQKICLDTAEVGNNIVLDVEGPITHAVMWGKTVL